MVKLTIETKKENQLLERTELKGKIEFEKSTPSNVEVAAALAKELGKDLELIVIRNIYTKFSHHEALFEAVVYNSLKDKKKTELLTKHIKKKIEEEKKKAADAEKKEGDQ